MQLCLLEECGLAVFERYRLLATVAHGPVVDGSVDRSILEPFIRGHRARRRNSGKRR